MSDDGSGVPVAVTVKGDPAAIEKVLAEDPRPGPRQRGHARLRHAPVTWWRSGPTAAYRQQILAGGHLGDTDAFRAVIPDAGHASLVVYVDLDNLDKVVSQLSAGRPAGGRQPEPAAGVRVLGVDRRRRRPDLAQDLDGLKRAVELEYEGSACRQVEQRTTERASTARRNPVTTWA